MKRKELTLTDLTRIAMRVLKSRKSNRFAKRMATIALRQLGVKKP